MNKAAVKRVTAQIAQSLINIARSILAGDVGLNERVERNTLKDSALSGELETIVNDAGDPVISALFNHYVVFLEWTRPKKYGKKPPINVLRDWAAKNGIPTDADTLWAISYAIWRDGHAGRPIFSTLDRYADRAFDEGWAYELFGAITSDLDIYFKD